MRYGFTDDGMLATFTDVDQYLDPESCLDLPMPSKRSAKRNIEVGDVIAEHVFRNGVTFIPPMNDGMKFLKAVIEASEQGDVVFDRANLNKDIWRKYLLNPHQKINKDFIQTLVKTHARTKRGNAVKQLALRNTVVRGILDVLHDPATQFDLQIPISMAEQKAAADLSTLAMEERYLTKDNPGSRAKMQIQNMVGRDVIGIGASSLKAFFAATTFYNTVVVSMADSVKNRTANSEELWKSLRSLLFNSKYSNRKIVTLANTDYDDLYYAITGDKLHRYDSITVSDLGLVDANRNIENLTEYVAKNSDGTWTINLLQLVSDLRAVANGNWKAPIDCSYSLSGLISAATDNAKELILSKINATSKFADIYTYLLSTGESFESIAKLMTSPVFNIVADYADGTIFDEGTKYFDLEHALKFVEDLETLPLVDNNIFNWILTYVEDLETLPLVDNNIFNWILTDVENPVGLIHRMILTSNGEYNIDWLRGLNTALGKNIFVEGDLQETLARLKSITSNPRDENNELTMDYQNLVAYMYKTISEDPYALTSLRGFIMSKIDSTRPSTNSEQQPEPMEEYVPNPDDYFEDAESERSMARSYNFKRNLSHDEWKRYLRYVDMYLVPKNQAMSEITDRSKLRQLREKILPALKEQRILSKILSINQGLKTKDFEEYKWIRDIESFINERYIDAKKLGKTEWEEFNLMKFLDPNQEKDKKGKTYRDRQIEQYELVKSTYNILDVITQTPHFWEMLKLSRVNRRLVEKSVALKYERILADKLLITSKRVKNGLSRGLTKKFNEQEFKILQNGIRDLITINWLNTLKGIKIKAPANKNLKYYKNGIPVLVDASFEGADISEADGMATFKWLMENYIVDELKKIDKFKHNAFIRALQGSYQVDRETGTSKEFITLPISLSNKDDNAETERRVNIYQNAFNEIYKEKVPESLGIGNWTIGDLFYLYNLYTFQDGFGQNAMTRLFEDMIINDDDSLLVNDYYNYMAKLDSGVETIPVIDEISKMSTADLANPTNSDAANLLKDIRLLFGNLSSAGSKFRVNVNRENGVVVSYNFMDAKYNKVGLDVPVSKLNRNDYTFPFIHYNPIRITGETPSLVSKRLSEQKIARKVNGREAVEIAVRHLQRSFGGVIPIVTINDAWLDQNPRFKNPNTTNVKGFVYNGQIYINTDHATTSTPVHELMHVICAALKYGTQAQRDMYYGLLNAINSKKNDGDLFWSKYFTQVSKTYEGYSIGSDFKEEVLIHAMEDIFTGGYLDALRQKLPLTNDSEITQTYKNFENRIIDAINTVFSAKLSADTTAKDALGMSLGELVYNFSQGLYNFSPSELTEYYVPINQRLTRFKREMVKNGNLTQEGDC